MRAPMPCGPAGIRHRTASRARGRNSATRLRRADFSPRHLALGLSVDVQADRRLPRLEQVVVRPAAEPFLAGLVIHRQTSQQKPADGAILVTAGKHMKTINEVRADRPYAARRQGQQHSRGFIAQESFDFPAMFVAHAPTMREDVSRRKRIFVHDSQAYYLATR